MPTHIKVSFPKDRALQLRAFAEQHGTTMSGAAGKLFEALYAHTDIVHEIPSIKINAVTDGAVLRIEDNKATGFGFEACGQLAQGIRDAIAKKNPGEKIVRFCPEHGGTSTIWRQGNSVKIAIPTNAPEKNFSLDLAEDFAALLDREAAKANA